MTAIEIEKLTRLIKDKIGGYTLKVNPDGSINVVVAEGGGRPTVDERSDDLVAIDNTDYFELVRYDIPEDETFYLREICVALVGFSAHFIVEYVDGGSVTNLRQYICNTQKPTFAELIGQSVPLPYTSNSPYVRVKAKMHSRQTGKAFAILNGYR